MNDTISQAHTQVAQLNLQSLQLSRECGQFISCFEMFVARREEIDRLNQPLSEPEKALRIAIKQLLSAYGAALAERSNAERTALSLLMEPLKIKEGKSDAH